ncbi:MAG: ATP-binding protein [Pseudomonadota bacterium]
MKRTSLEGRLAALLAVLAVTTGLLGWGLYRLDLPPWLATLLTCGGGILLALPLARLWTRPLTGRMNALTTAVAGLGDGDFGIGVAAGGGDEVDQLVDAYNDVVEALRSERQNLNQRELLLDTVIQSTPVAMVLLDPRNKVVYANSAGRQLLGEGKKLEGESWDAVVSWQSEAARPYLASASDGLFSVEEPSGDRNVYLLTQKDFRLNARPHRLILLQQLTRELSRQEVATWKKVIRVISHELNNSVAPISSLAHTGKKFAASGDQERLERALDTITDRAKHLAGFIDRYARFARIAEPALERIPWDVFMRGLDGAPDFRVDGDLPSRPGRFDQTLLEQVMINLLKNAHEAGSDPGEVTISCRDSGDGFLVEVCDRGPGMSAGTLGQALVPFYSTKQRGSGIGLSLCREIVEAHDGRLSLSNRDGGGLRVRLFLPG